MPTLEQVLHDVQALPLADRQLLAELLKPPKSIEQLATEQEIKPFDFEAARQEAAGIWPEAESLDDFNVWLRESRNRNGGCLDCGNGFTARGAAHHSQCR